MTVPITVRFLDKMGSDVTACNAARQTFDKETSLNEDGTLKDADKSILAYLVRGIPKKEFDSWLDSIVSEVHNGIVNGDRLQAAEAIKDALIQYRNVAVHFAPFTHAKLSVQITAPLFVARQLWKSVVGLALSEHDLAWSEVSRRYVDSPPEFYQPEVLHLRADNVKQGCSADAVRFSSYNHRKQHDLEVVPFDYIEDAGDLYRQFLQDGIAPEEARAFLPQTTMTTWTWTGSLLAFCRIVSLRTDKHAQLMGTQEVGRLLAAIVKEHFPVSYELLVEGNGL